MDPTSSTGGGSAMSPCQAQDELGRDSEVACGGCTITCPQRRLHRGPAQPQRVVAEMPRRSGAGGITQRGSRGGLVRGKFGGLLVAPLRLAGHAAVKARLGQPGRQQVRL